MMTAEERIRKCILIEKINTYTLYSEKLGLENISSFRGQRIRKEGEITC